MRPAELRCIALSPGSLIPAWRQQGAELHHWGCVRLYPCMNSSLDLLRLFSNASQAPDEPPGVEHRLFLSRSSLVECQSQFSSSFESASQNATVRRSFELGERHAPEIRGSRPLACGADSIPGSVASAAAAGSTWPQTKMTRPGPTLRRSASQMEAIQD